MTVCAEFSAKRVSSPPEHRIAQFDGDESPPVVEIFHRAGLS